MKKFLIAVISVLMPMATIANGIMGKGIVEVGDVVMNYHIAKAVMAGSVEVNGVDMTLKILSVDEKTIQIGNGKESAISTETSGALIIPSNVIIDGSIYNVVSIADSAFFDCKNITSVEIPSSIKSSGKDAFLNCIGLQKVILPDLPTWCSIDFTNKLSNPLFYAKHLYSNVDTEITDLIIPDGVTDIGSYAFIRGLFNTVTIPGSVAQVGSYSFYQCLSLNSIKIAKGVERIKYNAFYGCTALNSIILPEGITRIDASAFQQCTNLDYIDLPSSITSIGNNAFKLCVNLRQIVSNIMIPFTFGVESFASIAPDAVLYVPVGLLTAYHYAGWTKEVFGGGIEEIGDVVENYNIENNVTADFIRNVVYPDDDYSYTKITDYTTVVTSYRKDIPSPVRIKIPVINDGEALVLKSYHNGTQVRSDTFLIGQRALEIWNLIPRTSYNYILYSLGSDGIISEVTQGTFNTKGQVRMMNIDGMWNFRDIGGWKLPNGRYVKYDKLFRSAELAGEKQLITSAGIYELLNIQGIGVELDFGDFDGSPVSDRLEYFYGSEYHISAYADGIKKRKTYFKNCFEEIVKGLRKGKKILYHCNAGADRTGTFSFLLEGLLGVSESDLAKDFELTSFRTNKHFRNTSKNTIEDAVYLDYKGLIDYIKTSFSGISFNEKIEQMALSIGISQKDIDDFRDLMTEPNVLSVSDLSILKGNTAKWSVCMANKDEITAFQFDIEVPQGISVFDIQLGDRKSGNHTVEFSKQADGTYRVVGSSPQSMPFNGNEGDLVNLVLSANGNIKKGDNVISIKNIVLTSPSMEKYYPADVSTILTAKDYLPGDADGSGIVQVSDILGVVIYIMGSSLEKGADANGDNMVNIADIVKIVNMIMSAEK